MNLFVKDELTAAQEMIEQTFQAPEDEYDLSIIRALFMPIRLPFHQAEKNFELRREQSQKKEKEEKLRNLSELTQEVSVVIKEGLKNRKTNFGEYSSFQIHQSRKQRGNGRKGDRENDRSAGGAEKHQCARIQPAIPRTPEGSQRNSHFSTRSVIEH